MEKRSMHLIFIVEVSINSEKIQAVET